MHPAEIELKARALISALTARDIIVLIGVTIFLVWSWGDILPALEHMVLTMRTAIMDDVAEDVMMRLSQTLIPFGTTCSKLVVTTLLCCGLIYLINRAEWLGYDWDQNIKALKKEKKQKTNKLEADITRIELISKKAVQITAAAKDIDVLADKLERLKLEASKPAKTKAEPNKSAPKTAELFLHKPNGKPPPARSRAPQRPEF